MITITIITIMITITIINPVEPNIPFLCPREKNGLKWVKLGNTSMYKLLKMITDNWLKIAKMCKNFIVSATVRE